MGGEVLARVPPLLEGPAGGAATSASGAVSARAVSERASSRTMASCFGPTCSSWAYIGPPRKTVTDVSETTLSGLARVNARV